MHDCKAPSLVTRKLASISVLLIFSVSLFLLLQKAPAADVLQPPTECYVIGMNAKSTMLHTKPRTVYLVRGE